MPFLFVFPLLPANGSKITKNEIKCVLLLQLLYRMVSAIELEAGMR